jgi:hypothetical protein
LKRHIQVLLVLELCPEENQEAHLAELLVDFGFVLAVAVAVAVLILVVLVE